MLNTLLRLYASTARLNSAQAPSSPRINNRAFPKIWVLIVPNGCSTVLRRRRITLKPKAFKSREEIQASITRTRSSGPTSSSSMRGNNAAWCRFSPCQCPMFAPKKMPTNLTFGRHYSPTQFRLFTQPAKEPFLSFTQTLFTHHPPSPSNAKHAARARCSHWVALCL